MSEGVVLTRDAATFDLRTYALRAYDWSGLLTAGPARGSNRVVPGQPGTAVRPRVGGELRTILPVRVSGRFDGDLPRNGGHVLWREATLELLDGLVAFLTDPAPATVTVHRVGGLGPLSGLLQVEDVGTPRFDTPQVAVLIVDVTVPAGRLTVPS